MGNIVPFRGLWRRPPRKLPTPFLRKRRSRLRALLRHSGFFALAVVTVAAGYYLLGRGFDGSFSPPRLPIPDGSGTRTAARTNPQAETRPDTPRPHVTAGRHANAVDGDSLRIGDISIRLDGIDAPELRQTCRNADGREWPCGRAARERLAEFVSGREVICTEKGRDRYDRMLAVCAAGDLRDLGEALVLGGYAVNYNRYTDRYASAQSQARSTRRGIWSGSFEAPEGWRRRNPRRESVGWSGR